MGRGGPRLIDRDTDALADALLDRTAQLDGDRYETLLPLARAMESQNRPLAASAVYRSLLDAILRKARTNTYPIGLRYLRRLDRLAESIADWRHMIDHTR